MEIKFEDLEIDTDAIGSGSFGEVYRGKWKPSEKEEHVVALKRLYRGFDRLPSEVSYYFEMCVVFLIEIQLYAISSTG